MPNPEPLSSLYRRVVEAVPEAKVYYYTSYRADFVREALVMAHWQRLSDVAMIHIELERVNGVTTFSDHVTQEQWPTRLHALGAALIAYADRSKSNG